SSRSRRGPREASSATCPSSRPGWSSARHAGRTLFGPQMAPGALPPAAFLQSRAGNHITRRPRPSLPDTPAALPSTVQTSRRARSGTLPRLRRSLVTDRRSETGFGVQGLAGGLKQRVGGKGGAHGLAHPGVRSEGSDAGDALEFVAQGRRLAEVV